MAAAAPLFAEVERHGSTPFPWKGESIDTQTGLVGLVRTNVRTGQTVWHEKYFMLTQS